MPRKNRKKPKGRMPANPFLPGNPGGPGRPKSQPPPEPVLEAGVPRPLAVVRAALLWEHRLLPQDPAVRVYVQLKQKDKKGFTARWEALEKQFAGLGGGEEVVKTEVVGEVVEERVHDVPTQTVKLMIEGWLEKHRVLAEGGVVGR